MAGLMKYILGFHNWRNGVTNIKTKLVQDEAPLRMGVLGAAVINLAAFFDPLQTHPGVKLTGLAARSLAKAQAQIAEYKLTGTQAYGSYDELIAASDIDAVYIPLPNGLHAEWAIKAMEAGKHVLVEKPIASNANEARQLRDVAQRTGKVALEAFHWRFHPACHTLKALIDSGDYGSVQEMSVFMYIPAGAIDKNDIRFNYDLAGGAAMDLTYVFSTTSYFGSPDMLKASYNVKSAVPRKNKSEPRVDEQITASYTIDYPGKPQVLAHVDADLARPKLWGLFPRYWELAPGITIELEKARITFNNFVGPTFTHSIVIQEKDGSGKLTGKKRTERAYKDGPFWGKRGESWWTTYRYQLEAFVEKATAARDGRDISEINVPWMSLDESVKLMELIDAVYDKAGMPLRGG